MYVQSFDFTDFDRETNIGSDVKSNRGLHLNHILTQNKIKKIRELKGPLINNEDFILDSMKDLDNVFTSATNEDEVRHITLSAFSRPEKYYKISGVVTPTTPSQQNSLMKLMSSRQKFNERFTPVNLNRNSMK